MKEKIQEQFRFSERLKEELILKIVYQNYSIAKLTKRCRLPNAQTLNNWVNNYKRKLSKGAVTLLPMEKSKLKDVQALRKRIKQLEKSLEKANVLIYGLNSMIDYAEKELNVPVRKKAGTKQLC